MEGNPWGPVSPIRIDWSEQQHRGYVPHSVFMRPEYNATRTSESMLGQSM